MAHDAADTNWKIAYGGGVPQTPIDLGANFPVNTLSVDAYELVLFAPPTGGIHWEVTRLNTGHVALGFIPDGGGTSLPSASSTLSFSRFWRTNNATALAVGIDIMSDYIETDF
jgi:hypothetical protein